MKKLLFLLLFIIPQTYTMEMDEDDQRSAIEASFNVYNEVTELIKACTYGYTEDVRAFVFADAGKSINDKNCQVAFIYAASHGHLEIVEIFLAAGVEINAKDSDADTALMQASLHGHVEVVRLLLKKGADIFAKDKAGRTALLLASLGNKVEIVKLLINAGAIINDTDDWDQTPLMTASYYGNCEIVNFLLEAGAEVNCSDIEGCTALMKAAVYIRYPYSQDMSAYCKSRDNLDTAEFLDAAKTVKSLIYAGAKINAEDHNGFTAFLWALSCGNFEVMKVLLNAGASIVIKDNHTTITNIISDTKPSHLKALGLLKIITAFLEDPIKLIPEKNNGYISSCWRFFKKMINWSNVDPTIFQYLIWSISYNNDDAYNQIKKHHQELFQDLGIVIKAFLLAAQLGNVAVIHHLKKTLKARNIDGLRIFYLYAVRLIMMHHPEISQLAHQLMAEEVIPLIMQIE